MIISLVTGSLLFFFYTLRVTLHIRGLNQHARIVDLKQALKLGDARASLALLHFDSDVISIILMAKCLFSTISVPGISSCRAIVLPGLPKINIK